MANLQTKKNSRLQIIAIQSGRRFYAIERAADFWPGKLSKLIWGALDPTDADKVALAKVLGREPTELFPPEPVENFR